MIENNLNLRLLVICDKCKALFIVSDTKKYKHNIKPYSYICEKCKKK